MAKITPAKFQLVSNQTAVALIIPENLQTDINSLRAVHDKAFRKWSPHINVLYPFVESERLAAATSIFCEALKSGHHQQLSIEINDTGVFKHRRNATIFLKPSQNSEEAIQRLRSDLLDSLGCQNEDGTHDGTFRPHLTIGQASLIGNSIQKLVEQARKLPKTEWRALSLAVLKREPSGVMKVVENLALDGSTAPPNLSQSTETSGICYRFDPDTGWIVYSPIETSFNPSLPRELSIMTYNLLADSELEAPSFKSRMPLIMSAISSIAGTSLSGIHVLCLQEINEDMLRALLGDPFIQKQYPFSTHMPDSMLASRRNLVTLASRPFRYRSLHFSERHKTSLIITMNDTHESIANVHLTSGLTDAAVAAKKNQMEALTEFLFKENKRSIIIAGDFNLTTSSHTIETALSRNLITSETAQDVQSLIDKEIWDDAFKLVGSDEHTTKTSSSKERRVLLSIV